MRKLFASILTLAALVGCGLFSQGEKGNERESGKEGGKSVSRRTDDSKDDGGFAGTYELYQGDGPTLTLTVKRFEKGYKLEWETNRGDKWQGYGFALKVEGNEEGEEGEEGEESVLAVESSREPGIFGFYKKQGSKLTGIFTSLDGAGYFTERSPGASALRPSVRDLSGEYSVIGFDGEGEGYEQTYVIKRTGQTYKMFWGSEENPMLTAAGIASGDFFCTGVGVGGGITVRIYKVEGSRLNGWFFYSEYDDMEHKDHLVVNGEIAEKE